MAISDPPLKAAKTYLGSTVGAMRLLQLIK